MIFIYKKQFLKDLHRETQNKSNLRTKVDECIMDFEKNLFASLYYRKKLKGYLHIHELEVTGDYRMLIEVLIVDDTCTFLRFGTHSSLELSGSKGVKL